jgi:hypothetical protein
LADRSVDLEVYQHDLGSLVVLMLRFAARQCPEALIGVLSERVPEMDADRLLGVEMRVGDLSMAHGRRLAEVEQQVAVTQTALVELADGQAVPA